MSIWKWGGALATAGLLGCSSQVEQTKPLELTIAHINDHLSHLSASKIDLKVGGQETRIEIGGFPRVVEKIKQIESKHQNTLKVHSGNAITGNIFFTLFEGEADAAQMQFGCFDVFNIGSNDFNAGEPALREFITRLNNTADCNTTAISSNIRFKVGASVLALNKNDDFVKPYAIKEFNGEPVGIIGVVNSKKTSESSNPRQDTQFLDEQKSVQNTVKALHKEGINKIVLVSSLGYEADVKLVNKLSGVSVVIGSDSHTLMGDFSTVGLQSSAPYPAVHADKDGNKVCIAHAWHYNYAVGELNVTWNASGQIQDCTGVTNLLFGSSFQVRKNNEWVDPESGERSSIGGALIQLPGGGFIPPNAEAQESLSNFERRVTRKQRVVIGEAPENLCLERVPGQGKSQLCDVSLTTKHGSDISNIVAKSFMLSVKSADIGIQNGGGVRTDIHAGPVTLGYIQNLLPFGNTLVELEMTGAEIRQVLEEALTHALGRSSTTGSYPYASGLRWDIDASRSDGGRITRLEVNPRLEGEWAAIDPAKTYHVVTNNYIASGHDGYVTFGRVVKDRRYRETFLNYTQPMAEYVKTVKVVEPLPLSEYSTQNFKGK